MTPQTDNLATQQTKAEAMGLPGLQFTKWDETFVQFSFGFDQNIGQTDIDVLVTWLKRQVKKGIAAFVSIRVCPQFSLTASSPISLTFLGRKAWAVFFDKWREVAIEQKKGCEICLRACFKKHIWTHIKAVTCIYLSLWNLPHTHKKGKI